MIASVGIAALGLWVNRMIDPGFKEGIYFVAMTAIFWASWLGGLWTASLTGCLVFWGLHHYLGGVGYRWNFLEIQSDLQWILFICSAILFGWLGIQIREQVDEKEDRDKFQKFISDLRLILESAPDLKAGLAQVGPIIVPQFADWCMIEALNSDNSVQRLLVQHFDPARSSTVRELMRQPSDLLASGGLPQAIRNGKSVRWPRPQHKSAITVEPEKEEISFLGTSDRRQLELIRELGVRSYITAIGSVQKKHRVAVTWVRSRPGTIAFSEEDLRQADEVAHQFAWALAYSKASRVAKETSAGLERILSTVSGELTPPLTSLDLKISAMIRSLNSEDLRKGLNSDEILNILKPEECQKYLIQYETNKEIGLENLSKHARSIRQIVTRLRRFTDDLQDVSKLGNGTLKVTKKAESLGTILTEFVDLLQAIVTQKSIRIKAEFSESLPSVICSRERIEQVLSTLFGNAIRFTPPGGIITVRAERQGSQVVISVRDSGAGIAAAELQRVFDPFSRVSESHGRLGGFSLAIAKGIIDAHSGRIWAECGTGEGSTFYFTLPAAEKRPSGLPVSLRQVPLKQTQQTIA